MLGHLFGGPAVLGAEVNKGPWMLEVWMGRTFWVFGAFVEDVFGDAAASGLAPGMTKAAVEEGEELRTLTPVAVEPVVECNIV